MKPAALQNVPSEAINLFVEVARICRAADAFLTEKNKVTSPVLRVQMFERGAEWTEQLQALQQKLNARRDELMQELKSMNRAWESPDTHRPLERLEELYRHVSFIARWVEQLQERVVQLSL